MRVAQTAAEKRAKRIARYNARIAARRCIYCNAGLDEDELEQIVCVECCEMRADAQADYEARHPGRKRVRADHKYVPDAEVNKARREAYALKRGAKKCTQQSCKEAAYGTSRMCKRHRAGARNASLAYERRKHWPRIAARNLARVARAVADEQDQPLQRAA